MVQIQQLLKSFIPITQFNKGRASQIFDRLNTEKRLIVLKNNQPTAIILSVDEYSRLAEIDEDYKLVLEAQNRLEKNANNSGISEEQVLKIIGITEEDIENAIEPEFE